MKWNDIDQFVEEHKLIEGINDISGIYAILIDNVIVYVGQSIHIRTRLKQHIYRMENANLIGKKMYELLLSAKLGGCKIDYVVLEAVPENKLKDVETSWICDLLPILNDKYTPYNTDNLTVYQVLDFVRSRRMKAIKELNQ